MENVNLGTYKIINQSRAAHRRTQSRRPIKPNRRPETNKDWTTVMTCLLWVTAYQRHIHFHLFKMMQSSKAIHAVGVVCCIWLWLSCWAISGVCWVQILAGHSLDNYFQIVVCLCKATGEPNIAYRHTIRVQGPTIWSE